MSTAVVTESRIGRVEVSDGAITAHLTDGRVISVPLAWSWRLPDATPAQRANWQLIGDGSGIHWPDVDEDISGACQAARQGDTQVQRVMASRDGHRQLGADACSEMRQALASSQRT